MLRETLDTAYAVHTILEEIERASALVAAGGYAEAVRISAEAAESESLLTRAVAGLTRFLRETPQ